LKFKGICSIDQASGLVGTEIRVPEEMLGPLEDYDFYHFQIVGCTVLLKDGHKIGMVKDMLSIKDNDLLVIKKGHKEVLIPFSKTICLEIDLKKKQIIIDPPDGLLELDEI
jgi:16S rRNA processing protein RimM